MVRTYTFTYIIKHFVQLCGVHDELWISNHVVYRICLMEKNKQTVNDTFLHQAAVLYLSATKQTSFRCSCIPKAAVRKLPFSHLFFCCFFRLWVHPAHILQAVLKCPFNLCNHILSLKHRGDRRKSQKHIISHSTSQEQLSVRGRTYNGLAVLCKGGFDKHGSQSKAQGAVCVTDAQLPAWSAALQQQINTLRHIKENVHLIGMWFELICFS